MPIALNTFLAFNYINSPPLKQWRYPGLSNKPWRRLLLYYHADTQNDDEKCRRHSDEPPDSSNLKIRLDNLFPIQHGPELKRGVRSARTHFATRTTHRDTSMMPREDIRTGRKRGTVHDSRALFSNESGTRLLLVVLVGVRGFEPPTPASRTQYSTRLSYTPKLLPTNSTTDQQHIFANSPEQAGAGGPNKFSMVTRNRKGG